MERDGSEMTCVGAQRRSDTEQNRKGHCETRQGELTHEQVRIISSTLPTAGAPLTFARLGSFVSSPSRASLCGLSGSSNGPDRQREGTHTTNCAKSPESKPPAELYSIDTQRSRYLETTSSDLLVATRRKRASRTLHITSSNRTHAARRPASEFARGTNHRTSSQKRLRLLIPIQHDGVDILRLAEVEASVAAAVSKAKNQHSTALPKLVRNILVALLLNEVGERLQVLVLVILS